MTVKLKMATLLEAGIKIRPPVLGRIHPVISRSVP